LTPNAGASAARKLLARRLRALASRSPAPFRSYRLGGRRTVCRNAVKHSFDAEILIEVRPMHALSGSDQAPIRPLLGRGFE
jgi:hypothetical protein